MWKDISEFKKDFIDALEEKLDPGYIIMTDEISKINGVTKTGIFFQCGTEQVNIAPTLYIEDIYEHYKHSSFSFDEIVSDTYEKLVNAPKLDDISQYFDPEYVKENVQIEVINKEMNHDYLMDKPYMPVKGFDDLAAIVKIKVNDISFLGTQQMSKIVVTDALLFNLNISRSEIFEMAVSNSVKDNPVTLKGMMETLQESMFPDGVPEDDPMASMMFPPEMDEQMYVLSNKEMFNGASVIMYPGVMEDVYEKLGEDFIIIPSSIHEVLIVRSADQMDAGYMLGMIHDINEGIVDDCEVLSNNMYHYSGVENKVTTIAASDMEKNLGAEM